MDHWEVGGRGAGHFWPHHPKLEPSQLFTGRGGAAAGRVSHRPGVQRPRRVSGRGQFLCVCEPQFPGLENGLQTSQVLNGWGKKRTSRGQLGLEVRERL